MVDPKGGLIEEAIRYAMMADGAGGAILAAVLDQTHDSPLALSPPPG